MKYILAISLLLAGLTCSAQDESLEFDFNKDYISDKWFAGSALVYDCEEKTWVCVTPPDHKKCGELRALALRRGKISLDCAPGEIFEYRDQCKQEQRRLVTTGMNPRVCLNPAERSRFIGFR